MDLDECFRKNLIKKTRIDKELIRSLIETANNKELTIKRARLDEISISAYITMAYDSLREILESICISKGFKVLSHICIGELLRNHLEDFDYNQFDRFRWIRNSISYYGKKIELKEGEEIIKDIFNMKNKILKKYLDEF